MKVIKSTVAMVLSLSLLSTSCIANVCFADQAINEEIPSINYNKDGSSAKEPSPKTKTSSNDPSPSNDQKTPQKDSNFKETFKKIFKAGASGFKKTADAADDFKKIVDGIEAVVTIVTVTRNLYKWGTEFVSSRKESYLPLTEAQNNLENLLSNSSNGVLYGQEEAKRKLKSYISDNLVTITQSKDSANEKTFRNVIYVIGPSGTGKTTAAKAIANAILKNPNESVLLIDTSLIDINKNLGDQLFKIISVKDVKNKDGIYEKDKKSPIYEQLDKKPKSVIILDDYDKMKMLPSNQFSNNDYDSENLNVIQDRTADEVLKSIAENGKYYANGNLVDCSKAIFIVTTNENKDEVEKYFGVSGKKGGGIQRLRIAEFKPLSFKACQKIIKKMLYGIMKKLTDTDGLYKLNSFEVDEKSINSMANDMCDDLDLQGRLSDTFYSDIMLLFNENVGKEYDKSFKLIYHPSNEEGMLGTFEKVELNDDVYNCRFKSVNLYSSNKSASQYPDIKNERECVKGSVEHRTMSYGALFNYINKLKKNDIIPINENDEAECSVNRKILIRLLRQIDSRNWENNDAVKIDASKSQANNSEVFVKFEKFYNNITSKEAKLLEKKFKQASNKIRALLNDSK